MNNNNNFNGGSPFAFPFHHSINPQMGAFLLLQMQQQFPMVAMQFQASIQKYYPFLMPSSINGVQPTPTVSNAQVNKQQQPPSIFCNISSLLAADSTQNQGIMAAQSAVKNSASSSSDLTRPSQRRKTQTLNGEKRQNSNQTKLSAFFKKLPDNLPNGNSSHSNEMHEIIDLSLEDDVTFIDSANIINQGNSRSSISLETNEKQKSSLIDEVIIEKEVKTGGNKSKKQAALKNPKRERKKRYSFFRNNRYNMDGEEAEAPDDDEFQPDADASSLASTSTSPMATDNESENESAEEADDETLQNKNKSSKEAVINLSDSEEDQESRISFRLPPRFFPLYKINPDRKFGYGISKTGKEKGRLWLETSKDKNKIYIFVYFSIRSDATRYICNRCSNAGKHTILELQQGPNGIVTMMEDPEHVGDCLFEWKDFQNEQELCKRYIDRRKDFEEKFPPDGFRLVPSKAFEFGYNRYRVFGSRIIIREETNSKLAREYNIHSPFAGMEKETFRCVGCVKKKYVPLYVKRRQENGIQVAAPFNWKHLPSCKPKPYTTIMETQRKIKDKLKEIKTKKSRLCKKNEEESSEEEEDEDEEIIEDNNDTLEFIDSENTASKTALNQSSLSGREEEEANKNTVETSISPSRIQSTEPGPSECPIAIKNEIIEPKDIKPFNNATSVATISFHSHMTPAPDIIVIEPHHYEFMANNTILIIRETAHFDLCREFSAIINLRNFNSHLKFLCKTCLPHKSFIVMVEKKEGNNKFEVRMKSDETHHYKCFPKIYNEIIKLQNIIVKIENNGNLDQYGSASSSEEMEDEENDVKIKSEEIIDVDEEAARLSSPSNNPETCSTMYKRKQPTRSCKNQNFDNDDGKRKKLD